MASLIKQPNGRWRIQYLDGFDRKGISLGKMQKSQAQDVKRLVENLIAAKFSGLAIDQQTALWVSDIDDEFHSRIAAAGLLTPRKQQRSTKLAEFIESYIDSRPDVKESTKKTWRRVKKHLVDFFGADRDITTLTKGDAKDFYIHMGQTTAENTKRRTMGIAKQFFHDAVDRELLTKNVFKSREMPVAVGGNKARQFFITREMSTKILEACPNDEWRLIFALCRFGGLRCPSEVLALRWEHINLDCNRITVPSPKTEHHDGGDSRVIPLFPEIEVPLNAVAAEARPGIPWIITRYRGSEVNLRTQFKRILMRAGIAPWPKLFHNLRSSREDELIKEGHNPYVVCSIIGNSHDVMKKHYLQNKDSELDSILEACAECVQ